MYLFRRLLPCLALLTILSIPSQARADASPTFDFSGFYVPFGVNVGAALRSPGNNGLLLGGELSALYFWEHAGFTILGGYADYLRDFGLGVHRVSFGPEFGMYFCGLDAGPVFEVGHGATHLGGRARLFASLAFLTLYVGEWYRPAGAPTWSTEIGVLLKLPTLHYKEGKGMNFDI